MSSTPHPDQRPSFDHRRLPEPKAMHGRLPQHDLDAEAAVLSACLLDPVALGEATAVLEPMHFYSHPNREIWLATLQVAESGQPVDVVTVKHRLRDTEKLQRVGGAQYLAQVIDATPKIENVLDHVGIVVCLWRVRTMAALCHRIAASCYGEIGDTADFIKAADEAWFALMETTATSRLATLSDVIRETLTAYEDAAENPGAAPIKTGFVDLDSRGLRHIGGELEVIGGRPGMGKSAYALANTINASRAGGVIFFSLEMTRTQLGQRAVALLEGVDLSRWRHQSLNKVDHSAILSAEATAKTLPLFLRSTPGLTVQQVESEIRLVAQKMRMGGYCNSDGEVMSLRVVVIDYLQLMTGTRTRNGNREQEVAGLSKGLKQLAIKYDLKIIVLSQLNRGLESRDDKRPRLSDLRESGAIEQDADIVTFVYRDEYYTKDQCHPDDRGIVEIAIGKHRSAPVDGPPIRLQWDGPRARCRDLIRFDGRAAE